MVDCLCVWLYCTLGFEQLSKATVLLECKRELRLCISDFVIASKI